MTLEEKRAREAAMNRAKVKRFHERNPDYFKDRKKLKKLNNPTYRTENTGAFRTYELIDPRDEDRFPRSGRVLPEGRSTSLVQSVGRQSAQHEPLGRVVPRVGCAGSDTA